jgi:hypothetical protein
MELPAKYLGYMEFDRRRDGMIHAMEGGLWLHRHVWKGRAMAHLVSTDRDRLLAYGRAVGLPAERLQFKPLKDPRTNDRREAWHWDLVGRFLPPAACDGRSSGVPPSETQRHSAQLDGRSDATSSE